MYRIPTSILPSKYTTTALSRRNDLQPLRTTRPPSKVTNILLDFPSLRTYHTNLFQAITPLDPSYPDPSALDPGNQLRCEISPPSIGTITQNTPDCFEWKAPPSHGLLSGVHRFRFEESKVTKDGTTFVQNEEFWGFVFWAVNPWLMGRVLKRTYEGFNEDLKGKVEGMEEG